MRGNSKLPSKIPPAPAFLINQKIYAYRIGDDVFDGGLWGISRYGVVDCHGEMKISRLLQGAPANFLPVRCGNRWYDWWVYFDYDGYFWVKTFVCTWREALSFGGRREVIVLLWFEGRTNCCCINYELPADNRCSWRQGNDVMNAGIRVDLVISMCWVGEVDSRDFLWCLLGCWIGKFWT